MSKITDAFKKGKAFIGFLTCGDPDLATTAKLIPAMEKAGTAVIELGIPFSDPTAEGPVIQQANERALKGGVTTDKIFDMVEKLDVSAALVIMTYANVVFTYGIDRFARRAKEVGISGLILPDVPYEERDEFGSICEKEGIDLISMVAPTSKDRIATIAKEAKGFVYCVSSLGVTGQRSELGENVRDMVKSIREVTDIPVAVGFGVSAPAQAQEICKYADGVIVGSAIVNIIGEHGEDSACPVYEYVKEMTDSIS